MKRSGVCFRALTPLRRFIGKADGRGRITGKPYLTDDGRFADQPTRRFPARPLLVNPELNLAIPHGALLKLL